MYVCVCLYIETYIPKYIKNHLLTLYSVSSKAHMLKYWAPAPENVILFGL